MKKILLVLFVFIFTTSFLVMQQPAQASAVIWRVDNSPVKLDARLNLSNQTDVLTVIVTLRQQADLARVRGTNRAEHLQGVIQALQSTANATQGSLNSFLNIRRAQGREIGRASCRERVYSPV